MKKPLVDKQIKIDTEELYRLAKAGNSAQEIMQELNIADMATLKNALQGMMQEKSEEIQVPGFIDSAAVTPRYTDEGIRINPEMLSGCEFKAGDEFRLAVKGDKIILEKKS